MDDQPKCAVEEAPVSGIERELRDFDSNLDRLEKIIAKHSETINKVLTDHREEVAKDGAVPSHATPLAQVLQRQNDRLNSLITEIYILNDRVEL